VIVEDGARVRDSVLMDGVHVGRGAVVERAILDKNVVVPDGVRIGGGEPDRRFTVTEGGITVLGKNEQVLDG
jgi:glucose-1-phosphate adenylyltransferase